MKSPLPTGYFFKNIWSSASCQTGSFFSADTISRCLKGKKLKLMGDSTVRQWQETLMNTLKGNGNVQCSFKHNNLGGH